MGDEAKRSLGERRRIAEWQLLAGWATAAATLVARLTTVALQLGSGPLDLERFGLAILKSGFLLAVVLCIAATPGLRI